MTDRLADTDDADGGSAARWMAAMLQGNFEAAWRESDAVRARGNPDPHRFWDGESLRQKRVMVRSLHGFGDAVQMLRYALPLKGLASSVVWQVAPRFVELACCFATVDEVVTWGDAAPARAPEWESQVEVMELPYIFRTTRESLPIAEGYCRVPREEVQRVRSCMRTAGPAVGLVWAAGEWDQKRSLPYGALQPLLETQGVTFWSLQGGTAHAAGVGLLDASALCGNGLLALAATIANLDLVIAVDTLAAHLAGAMGKRVWLMLQKQADWRWMAKGDRSPWYPTMRLFRQQRPGDWAEVIGRVRRELKKQFKGQALAGRI